MSADGSIELMWAGEERRFRIGIGEFRNLQESVNARRVLISAPPVGPAALLQMLRTNDAWPDDVRDVLKAGLVGGGATLTDAAKLLVRQFDGKPVLEHTKTAFLILLASLVGVPDDEPISKKKDEEDGRDEPVKFSVLYGNGAAIGFTPAQVDACSFWQFRCCEAGYRRANQVEETVEAPSDAEFDDMVARLS